MSSLKAKGNKNYLFSKTKKQHDVTITTGEKKLLKKLINFSKKSLMAKNAQAMIIREKFQTYRPISACGKLETPSADKTPVEDEFVLDGGVGVTPFVGKSARPKTSGLAGKDSGHVPYEGNYGRRMTVIGHETSSIMNHIVNFNKIEKVAYNYSGQKVEEQITLNVLESMKNLFEERKKDSGVDLDEFIKIMRAALNNDNLKESDFKSLFSKIDCYMQGRITWDDICTYMQLTYTQTSEAIRKKKLLNFILPARYVTSPHRDTMVRIVEMSKNEFDFKMRSGLFASCSKDGYISFWSTIGPKMKKMNRIFPVASQKQKWATDFAVLSQFNKIVISTGDREIQFYELSSFEPYCQLSEFETVPLQMDCCCTDPDSCIISFGDTEGCVNVVMLLAVGESLRTWKRGVKECGISSVPICQAVENFQVQFYRWRAHLDWVQQIKYSLHWKQIMSCSENEKTALVIGSLDLIIQQFSSDKSTNTTADNINNTNIKTKRVNISTPRNNMTVKSSAKHNTTLFSTVTSSSIGSNATNFLIYKGVKCFDASHILNIIVTGGMDKQLRIWNPYAPHKATSILKGHESPITFVCIAQQENKIFSVSTDKSILVWDLLDHTWLLSCRPKSHMVQGQLQACQYLTNSRCFVFATETMNIIQQKFKTENTSKISSHKEPVYTFVYNKMHKQVISACTNSVKVWFVCTGQLLFHFDNPHDNQVISCMSLDSAGRRLFTGSRNGLIKMWNYNNGQLLRTLAPKLKKERLEVTDVKHVVLNKNKFLVGVGWSKRITIYSDDLEHINKQTQPPLPYWPEDVKHGHQSDISSVTYCRHCQLLITSDYNHTIIVWNMISGHKITTLINNHPMNDQFTRSSDTSAGYGGGEEDDDDRKIKMSKVDETIPKVLFLTKFCHDGDSNKINLISLGSRGLVNTWRVDKGKGHWVKCFKVLEPSSTASLVTMATSSTNQVVVFGDSEGFTSLWDIRNSVPTVISRWRSHTLEVTCIQIVDGALDDYNDEINDENIDDDEVGNRKDNNIIINNINNINDINDINDDINNNNNHNIYNNHDNIYIDTGKNKSGDTTSKKCTSNVDDADNKYTCSLRNIFIVTSSLDCNVRMWNNLGHYVGTYGQSREWILLDPRTYIHPRVPHDVLTHPKSIHKHPRIPCYSLNVEDVLYGDDYDDDDDDDDDDYEEDGDDNYDDEGGCSSKVYSSKEIKGGDDNDDKTNHITPTTWKDLSLNEFMDNISKEPDFIAGTGKRLRYERTKPTPLNAGGPNIYQHLKVHDLQPIKTIEPPASIKKSKNNALTFLAELTKY